jgi:hypothetical protein
MQLFGYADQIQEKGKITGTFRFLKFFSFFLILKLIDLFSVLRDLYYRLTPIFKNLEVIHIQTIPAKTVKVSGDISLYMMRPQACIEKHHDHIKQ